MRRGALEYCVMALIVKTPRYAFELIDALGRTGLLTTEGTLYPLLSRLRRDGLVKTEWRESSEGPPLRDYVLTGEGRRGPIAFRSRLPKSRVPVDRTLPAGKQSGHPR